MRHHSNSEFQCNKCHKGCSTKALLDQHKTNQHDDGVKFECSERKNGCEFPPTATKFYLGESQIAYES